MTQLLPCAVVAERTGLGERTIYRYVSEGRFPQPVQLTTRRVGWVDSEIEDWIQQRIGDRDAGRSR